MNSKLWNDRKSQRDSVYVPERRERQRHIRANGGRVEGVNESMLNEKPILINQKKLLRPGLMGRLVAKFIRQKTG